MTASGQTFTGSIAKPKAELTEAQNELQHWRLCADMEKQTSLERESEIEQVRTSLEALRRENQRLQRQSRKAVAIANTLKARVIMSNRGAEHLLRFAHKTGANECTTSGRDHWGAFLKLPLAVHSHFLCQSMINNSFSTTNKFENETDTDF